MQALVDRARQGGGKQDDGDTKRPQSRLSEMRVLAEAYDSIISRAVLVGLDRAVREMAELVHGA